MVKIWKILKNILLKNIKKNKKYMFLLRWRNQKKKMKN